MRRSCNSLTSLTSLASTSSINSHTKIYNNKDFKKYIINMEEDIIKVSNDYYYFAEKYDKKIYNFLNRYEERTNKLYIDLRNREAECRRLNNKIEYICNEVNKIKDSSNITKHICYISSEDSKLIDSVEGVSRNILFMLCVYTLFVISMVITY